jgi:hypothetical protein
MKACIGPGKGQNGTGPLNPGRIPPKNASIKAFKGSGEGNQQFFNRLGIKPEKSGT